MKRIVVPKQLGAEFGGGFYGGKFFIGTDRFALVFASKADGGEHEPIIWSGSDKIIKGAQSYSDGRQNTLAMARGGSALAKWARGLRIGGFRDWQIPARDQKELLYRYFKPGTYVCNQLRAGDNPSSEPPGYPYTTDQKQTPLNLFQAGGAEAFAEAWYWTSTQSASYCTYAWAQSFTSGLQSYSRKDDEFRARAVRSIPL